MTGLDGNQFDSEFTFAIASQLGVIGISGDQPVPTCLLRLDRALASIDERQSSRPSRLDLAVLIRQCLRNNDSQSDFSTATRIRVPRGPHWPTVQEWKMVGASAVPSESGTTVQAKPWLPDWLPDVTSGGVDGTAASERQYRRTTPVTGDPFLSRIPGHGSYQSPGQQSAVRGALCAPPGSTLVVCLPTGEGKSLVFQAIAKFGYGATDGLPGVTLVVTPTVALALDHQVRAREMGFAEHPTAYSSGMQQSEKQAIIERIKNGTQGLCFAAPEAVCGVLYSPLSDAARRGLLRALVVDEAHLVDTWGANFRAEFQLLGGTRSKIMEEVAPGTRPRTLLLSATFTGSTLDTLQSVFPGDPDSGGTHLISSTQLRPEIEYWAARPTGYEERKRRVTETLLHMPRPAILYVTEVSHAQEWHRSLRNMGFKRLAMLTGRSSTADRNSVVDAWRKQELDLVVGTSAFGLGIDHPNVRTVVHACVPETLDRYYQEVGRGGRDGRVAASIIVPVRVDHYSSERDDFDMARSLNSRRLLTKDVARRRWDAMFNHPEKVYEGDGVFRLRIDVPPGTGPQHIDMDGETNTGWNQRTLTLMANSGMLELLGPVPWREMESDDELSGDQDTSSDDVAAARHREVYRVKIVDPRHQVDSAWVEMVEPYRKSMESASRANLDKMRQFLQGRECAADLLAPVYEVAWRSSPHGTESTIPVARACGGCPSCRKSGAERYVETPQIPRIPWQRTSCVSAPASRLLDDTNRVVVFYDSTLDRQTLRRWRRGMASLASCGSGI
ncbi:MAG: protein DpdF [Chloroflexota bacterium]|nr:protein DpdF [Chloroflexota bacterium]